MFTGLIQDVGRIEALRTEREAAVLEIGTTLAAGLRPGDSLAVDGVCLTVTPAGTGRVRATAVAETLSRTTIGQRRTGDAVHLEAALRAGDPLGGHLVQGHVDGVGSVAGSVRRGAQLELTVTAPAALLKYVVEKGSIAVDGVSLTVAALGDDRFTVALVPHTLEHTTFGARQAGAAVNLEVDILAKYVERQLAGWRDAGGGVSEALLRKHGFI